MESSNMASNSGSVSQSSEVSYPSSHSEEEEEEKMDDIHRSELLVLKENSGKSKKTKISKFHSSSHNPSIRKKIIHEAIEDSQSEEETKNLRQIFDKFFSVNNRLFYLELVISIISSLSSIFFIVCTYKISFFRYMNYFDIIVCSMYFIEYFIKIVLAHHRFFYIISLESIINIITTIPSIFSFVSDDYKHNMVYMLINCSRVLRFLRIFRIFASYKTEENNVNRQILMICNLLLQLIVISAGIVQITEAAEVERRIKVTAVLIQRNALKMRTEFHHYIYFCIVSISTLGYGDIVLYTPLAKCIFIGVVLLVIILIPYLTNDLIVLMNAQNFYQRQGYKASKEIGHIILTGDISLDALKSFCQEFFHPDHGSQSRHAVIICKETPSREMEIFLNEKENENFLFYLQGDPLNEKDLIRGDISKAKACVIFNNKNARDPSLGEFQTLLIGTYVKKFVFNYNLQQAKKANDLHDVLSASNPSFHLCLQLNRPDSISHFYNSLQKTYKEKMKHDQFIIVESIKMNLLSKSCLTPGIMTLITNLVISSGGSSEKTENEWTKEYTEGRDHEIYRIQLSDYYKKMSFGELAENIYSQGQAIAFALEVEVAGVSTVKLNPSNQMKINQIISSLKDFQMSGNRVKDSNSIGSQTINGSRDKPIGEIERKARVFAYLICSDKEVADNIANREKDKFEVSYAPPQASTKNQESVTNLVSVIPDLVQNLLNPQSKANKEAPGLQSLVGQSTHYESDSDEDDSDDSSMVQFGISDLDFNKNDYYFHNQNDQYFRKNIEIMQHSIKDSEEVTNHIIICGLHPSLAHFILPLRAKYLQEETLKWIVILAPSLPQHLFEAFTKFSKIIFIQGSPLLPENLYRANIVNADKAVILSSGVARAAKIFHDNPSDITQLFSTEQMLDAETIFIYKAIKKCNRNIQIMTELICTNNIEYLLTPSNLQKLFYQKGETPQYEFTSLYASGEIYTPGIIDRITCQSYYNPHIVTIIELLLGGERATPNKKAKKLDEALKLGNSNLYLVKIPDSYVNESFEDFFEFLNHQHHTIGIALYRKNIIDGCYYVYTNPKKTTLLREYDFVFVLANTTAILDLVEERYAVDEENEESQFDEPTPSSDNEMDDEEKEDTVSEESSKKEVQSPVLMSGNEVPAIQPRKKISTMKRSTKSVLGTINGLKKKAEENGKYDEINKMEERLINCTKSLNEIKNTLLDLPNFIDEIADKETESELKVYLAKN